MRYTEIEVGQQVLVSIYRTSHKDFTVEDANLAVVTEKGVEHKYTAKVSQGWNYTRPEPRVTREGVRLHARRHRLTSPVAGGHDLDPEYDDVVIAARLVPFEGENRARWEAARAADAATKVRVEAADADERRKIMEFAAVGFEVAVKRGAVVIDSDDVPEVLRLLALGREWEAS